MFGSPKRQTQKLRRHVKEVRTQDKRKSDSTERPRRRNLEKGQLPSDLSKSSGSRAVEHMLASGQRQTLAVVTQDLRLIP